MRIYTYSKSGWDFQPIEIEVSLVPGLPGFTFLGLPDQTVKESEKRIRAALRASGFSLPKAKNVLIQLRPLDTKKHGVNFDLAIAIAYLLKTKQIQLPFENLTAFGELDLEGNIRPLDVPLVLSETETVITGSSENALSKKHFFANNLNELSLLTQIHTNDKQQNNYDWPIEGFFLNESESELAMISVLGRFPTLLYGPPGTGKSTLAESIARLSFIDEKLFNDIRKIQFTFNCKTPLPPIRRPHHTSTAISLIGGGPKLMAGEITRAHGGVLILDEFLEFSKEFQESLREPIETGKVMVARAIGFQEFPACFHLLATTNLCPCGEWTPSQDKNCRCAGSKQRSYFSKLSGPMLDRFPLVYECSRNSPKRKIPLNEIKSKLQILRNVDFRTISFETEALFLVKEWQMSYRREQALMNVAQALAAIKNRKTVSQEDIKSAYIYSAKCTHQLYQAN